MKSLSGVISDRLRAALGSKDLPSIERGTPKFIAPSSTTKGVQLSKPNRKKK